MEIRDGFRRLRQIWLTRFMFLVVTFKKKHDAKMHKQLKKYLLHLRELLLEQMAAVIPITLWLVISVAAFFSYQIHGAGQMAGGLIAAIFGLVMFLEGLRVSIMPLGDLIGRNLPRKFSLPAVLVIAFFLGILVTYAEPAIATLRPLALLVEKEKAPYLSFMLLDYQEILIFTISIGVGVSAVLGMLRFAKGWSLKPMIVGSLIPTIAAALYMEFGDPNLRPLLSLAWDCGAITTGSVTVPILISLGVGVSAGFKDKQKNEMEEQIARRTGSLLSPSSPSGPSDPPAASSSSLTASSSDSSATASASSSAPTTPSLGSSKPPSFDALALSELPTRPPAAVIQPQQQQQEDQKPEGRKGRRVSISIEDRKAIKVENIMEQFEAPASPSSASPSSSTSTSTASPALEGFGIVTLASIWPIFSVEVLAIILSLMYTKEEIINSIHVPEDGPADRTPVREIIFAVRAIMPLSLFLVLCVRYILKEPIPILTFALPLSAEEIEEELQKTNADLQEKELQISIIQHPNAASSVITPVEEEHSSAAPEIASEQQSGQPEKEQEQQSSAPQEDNATPAVVEPQVEDNNNDQSVAAQSDEPVMAKSSSLVDLSELESEAAELQQKQRVLRRLRRAATVSRIPVPRTTVPSILTSLDVELVQIGAEREERAEEKEEEDYDLSAAAAAESHREEESYSHPSGGSSISPFAACMPRVTPVYVHRKSRFYRTKRWLKKRYVLFVGIAFAQIGMMLFNIGLTYGFTFLGDEVGSIMPGAYMDIPDLANSPRFSYGGGIAVVVTVIFVLGVLATRAEPALNVLGKSVADLTRGGFSKTLLIWSVCVGVGVGMAIGATKILFGVSVMAVILAKYGAALLLTYFTSEDFSCIAWDSGAVTTGDVTVPFVLAIGIGFSKAVHATEGFGILTVASVSPIVTVLAADFARKGISKASTKIEQYKARRSMEAVRKSIEVRRSMENAYVATKAKEIRSRVLLELQRADSRPEVRVENSV